MPNALVPELSVTDCRASVGFYCDILGFALLYSRPEEGFAYLHLHGAELMLDQIGVGRDFDPGLAGACAKLGLGLNLQIAVPSVEPLLERLARAGITPHLALEDRWYRRNTEEVGARQFIVADPDGYLLRFQQDLGSRPARVTP